MIPEKEIFEELSAAYALGALEEEERALFEEGLNNGGDEYKRIVVESLGVSYLLNSSVKRTPPPMRVKAQVMKKILRGKNKSLSFSYFFEQSALLLGFGNPKFGLLISLLLLFVVIEVGVYAYLLYSGVVQHDYQPEITELSQSNNQLIQSNLDEEILTVLRSPKVELVSLAGTGGHSSLRGKIIWDPVSKLNVVQLSKLLPAPPGKTYQLWCIDKNNAAVSAGIFDVERETEHFLTVLKLPETSTSTEWSSFKITLEEKNGTTQPTGEEYLLGTIVNSQK